MESENNKDIKKKVDEDELIKNFMTENKEIKGNDSIIQRSFDNKKKEIIEEIS